LKYGFNVRCDSLVRDAAGNVIELLCTVDESNTNKVKGNLHWVSAATPGAEPLRAEARLYDHMFKSEDPMAVEQWLGDLNPNSEVVMSNVLCEPSLATAKQLDKFQFERGTGDFQFYFSVFQSIMLMFFLVGFFVVDYDTKDGNLVFNRSTRLKESKDKISA
jgi:glutaminyl-tRNA synthetase